MAHRGPRSRQRPLITLPASPSSSTDNDSNKIKFDLTNFSLATSKVLFCLQPTSEDIAHRERLIEDFKKYTTGYEKLRGCTFEPYGSYATKLYTRFGDIDLSVRHDDDDILSTLKDQITRAGEYLVTRYATKRLHVLTFKHKDYDIPFDITLHSASGKMTASLLSHIKDIDVRFRQLVLLVKGWAMCHGINDASRGGFKSYALYVMVILHLQTLESPILPPLSQICTSEVMRKMNDNDEGWKKEFDENLARYKELKKWKKNELDVHKVFYLFITKFMHIRKEAREKYMSPKEGKWVRKKLLMLKVDKTQPLWIEDPFGNPENLGRTIKKVTPIRSMFRGTYKAIKTGKANCILEKLVHRDLLKEIEREMDEIPMPSSMEVGIKAVASKEMISEYSSAVMIPRSSPTVPNPAEYDVLGLGCYLSDENDDKEGDSPAVGPNESGLTKRRRLYSTHNESIHDKELADSKKEGSPDNAEVKQSSSTSRLSLGTQEFSQNDAVEDEAGRDDIAVDTTATTTIFKDEKQARTMKRPKGVSGSTRFSIKKVDNGEDPKAARSGNHHKSAMHREWFSNSTYHPKSEGFRRRNGRESEGEWEDEDLYVRTRGQDMWKRERVEERMSRYAHKVLEYERRDKDRHSSKIESENGSWKGKHDSLQARHDGSGIHEKRIKEGVEKRRDRNEWKERVRSGRAVEDKTWIAHSRLKEDYRGEKFMESWEKQGRRESIKKESFSRHAGREDAYSHKKNRMIDDERRSRYGRVNTYSSLAPSKENREDHSIQRSDRMMGERQNGGQNHRKLQSFKKHEEDVLSEDEDSKRGHSKL